MKKSLLHVLLMLVTGISFAQVTVTGKIRSASDQMGIPGTSVVIKNTKIGVISDYDGNYTISAKKSDVLVFSFIGHKTQEVVVGDQTKIDITLAENISTLDEVIVVGYGTMKKKDMTSASVSLASSDIEKTVNTTVEQAIQGRAAGVYVTQNTGTPGGGMSVTIRGINSINGSNEPLYVVDGVQIEGTTDVSGTNPLSTLNPSDIESIDILEGPSATAIYGSRGTNGVVMITTKRGKAGKMKVNYTFLYSLQSPPKQLEVMDLRQYAIMDNAYKAANGGLVREEFLDPTILGSGTNWQDALFKEAPMSKHQLSISGGSDKTTYYLSGELLDQDGVAIGSGFKRNSVRLNLDNQATDWLKVGANVNFAQTDQQLATTLGDVIGTAITMSPAIPVRNADGTFGGGETRINADGSTSDAEYFSPPNPIGMASILTNEMIQRRLLGGLNMGINIVKGLEFKTALNADYQFNDATKFTPTYEWGYQINDINELEVRNETRTYWNWNQLLQYNGKFDKHGINVMASHEAQESTYKSLFASRKNFPTNDILDLNAGGIANQTNRGGQSDWAMESYFVRLNYNYDDRYLITNTFRADGSSNFGSSNKWGYFPSISLAWKISNESFFKVPAISDLRLRFESGVTGSQGNSGNIYARLNVYATEWGNGYLPANYPNTNYKWEETSTNNIGLNLGLFKDRIQIEADYYVKNTDNLITSSSLPWYMGTAPDATGSISAPVVNIGTLQNKGWGLTINSINIKNQAFTWKTSLNLSSFKAKITKLYSENSIISRLPPSWHISPQWTQRVEVGESPWYFYGYVEDGLYNSLEDLQNSPRPADNNGNPMSIGKNGIYVGDVKYKDLNGDGVITAADQTNIGSPWPKLFGGLTNSFSYKGFDLSVMLTGTYGNDVYNYLRMKNVNPGNINLGRNLLSEAANYAVVGSDEVGNPVILNSGTSIPRIDGNAGTNGNFDRHTTKFVEDGSFLRIKNITLNYKLPNIWLDKFKVINAMRVGVSAQNIYTFTKYTGYDPEVGSYVGPEANNGNASIGVDTGRYPLTPVYSFNFSVDF